MDPLINPLESYLISKNILKKERLLTGTIARIYFANSNKWENKKCGFLIILKSKITKGIIMKLVSFNFETLYEIEILQNSKFQKESSFFYSLGVNEIHIGICFAEGSSFDKFIQITEKYSKTKFSLNANLKEIIPKTKDFLSPRKRDTQTPKESFLSPRKNSNPPKLIISQPKNVQHSIHVGADSNRNFTVLKMIFFDIFSLMNCQRIGKSFLKK
jgi:hypothetical protein